MQEDNYVIENRQYSFRKMPVLESAKFAMRVGKVLAPALSADPEILEVLGDPEASNIDKLQALAKGFAMVDTDTLFELGKEALMFQSYAECLADTSSPKKSLSNALYLNEWFTKYPRDLIPVAKYAVTYQCIDFLPLAVDEN